MKVEEKGIYKINTDGFGVSRRGGNCKIATWVL